MGCRAVRDRAELVRLHRDRDGALALGAGPGRGAWVCSEACLDLARRRRALSRALRGEVPDHEVDGLRATMKDMGPEGAGE